jgi:hypothetical protein
MAPIQHGHDRSQIALAESRTHWQFQQLRLDVRCQPGEVEDLGHPSPRHTSYTRKAGRIGRSTIADQSLASDGHGHTSGQWMAAQRFIDRRRLRSGLGSLPPATSATTTLAQAEGALDGRAHAAPA